MSIPSGDYFLVKREPWQPVCDKCREPLVSPFCWTKRRTPYRTVCLKCGGKDPVSVGTRLIASAFYGPQPKDPRYE